MKTQWTLFSILLVCLTLTGIGKGNCQESTQPGSSNKGEVRILVSPELKSLAIHWQNGYLESHPGKQVMIETFSEMKKPDANQIYLTTEMVVSGENLWKMCVGHEIIVPVTHASNPYLEKIRLTGITPATLTGLMEQQTGWKMFAADGLSKPAKGYVTDDPAVLSGIAEYLQTGISEMSVLNRVNHGEIAGKIREDVCSFGFCRLSEVTGQEIGSFTDQLVVIPVDRNGNGRIDVFENVYSNPETLIRGVRTGRYPHQLTSGIFAVAAEKPAEPAMLEFLSWISQDGQDLLAYNGLCRIQEREKTANMMLFNEPLEQESAGTGLSVISRLLIGGFLLLVVLLVPGIIFYRRKKEGIIDAEDLEVTPVFNESTVLAPAGLYYDKSHTWAFMEKNGRVKVGVDDFIQHITGELTQVRMKKPGEKIFKGEKLITIIREGKQLDLYSPVTGTVMQKNELLEKNPSLMGSETYAGGWAYEIEPANWLREIRYLFMAGKYREWLEDEFMRLKDFMAVSANRNSGVYEHVVMQDGGELTDHVLADMGPEVWEDFQTRFIDSSR